MKRSFEGESTLKTKNCCEKFLIAPFLQFSGRETPSYRQPVEIGHFSLDGNRQFHDNAQQLRYYKPPKFVHDLAFNLRNGYDTCIQKDEETKERLTHLLMWLSKHRDKFRIKQHNKDIDCGNKPLQLHTDFIAWRGHFTKLLCTPYENREPWKMAVTLFNGTIYISEVETEKAKNDRLHRSKKHQEMCYWGFKFEDYVTEPITSEKVGEKNVVNTNEAFCTIVRSRLNQNSILIGAEVDCCERGKVTSAPPSNYVELKTTRQMQTHRQRENYSRFKLLKFWAQSFLAGVPKIVVGLRNDDGIIKKLDSIDTMSIPRYCKQFTRQWNANIAINFLDKLLNWIKSVAVVDNPDFVYMLSFDYPFEFVSVEVFTGTVERFLPEWFTNPKES